MFQNLHVIKHVLKKVVCNLENYSIKNIRIQSKDNKEFQAFEN